ncbi:hypothetical protein DKX38_023349 [Salix brachista]|uniref:Uncharacterized protein n=1 Tax=Salix brachista TaxID=2182728 RepID=A0A5N5JNG1_9ROSI|nr:hypothetical protein DKX38_023349 [Salix brachista]
MQLLLGSKLLYLTAEMHVPWRAQLAPLCLHGALWNGSMGIVFFHLMFFYLLFYVNIWVKPWIRPVVVGRPFWMRTGKYRKRQEKGNKRWAKQPSSVGFLMSQLANFAISISLSSDRPSSMKSNVKEQRMQVSKPSNSVKGVSLDRRIVYASGHMEAGILTGIGIKMVSRDAGIHLIKLDGINSLPCAHHMSDLNEMPCPIRTKKG